jgi:hypothetical protein
VQPDDLAFAFGAQRVEFYTVISRVNNSRSAGADISVCFSIIFRTPDLKRRRLVHICNAFLRRRGFRPAPAGTHPRQDNLKYFISGVAARIHQLFSGGLRL